MTKKETLSNLQIAMILALLLLTNSHQAEHVNRYVSGRKLARLLGYDTLTTYHRKLLVELMEKGWVITFKSGAFRVYGVSTETTRWAQGLIRLGFQPVVLHDEIPF